MPAPVVPPGPFEGQIYQPLPRPLHRCRWCGCRELASGEKRDFETLTDQWRLPDLCTPCCLIIGEYLHTHFHHLIEQANGLANGLAACGQQ
jgi:hypothetical protein